jgi:hypothetical protein
VIDIKPGEPVVTIVPRASVLTCDIEAVLMGLSIFVRSPVLAPQVQGNWQLSFDGLDHDSRELWEIPDVRRFLATLDRVFPYWFFLSDLGSGTLQLIASCLCRVTEIGTGQTAFHSEDLRLFVERQFGGMNQLWELHGLSDASNVSVSERIIEYFELRRILN